jgi:hypothetical protein
MKHRLYITRYIFITYVYELKGENHPGSFFIYICGGGIPTINVHMQMVCTFIGTFCKYTTCVMGSLKRCSLTSLVGGWLQWPGDCSSSRLAALMLGRLLGVLLFTEARSMGRAVQWTPMKPESWSGWFPLKSSPTCSYCWLHCDLQNMPRELLEMNVLTGPRHLAYCGVFHVCFSVSLSWGEIPYVFLSGPTRRPLVTIPVLRFLVTAVILFIELLLRYRFG